VPIQLSKIPITVSFLGPFGERRRVAYRARDPDPVQTAISATVCYIGLNLAEGAKLVIDLFLWVFSVFGLLCLLTVTFRSTLPLYSPFDSLEFPF
jgi:hypothetical protein